MKFSELQILFKEKYGIDYLADIARELGVSPQAVSNWKSRNRVPYKYVKFIRNTVGESSVITENKDQDFRNNSNNIDEELISIADILLFLARNLKFIIISQK